MVTISHIRINYAEGNTNSLAGRVFTDWAATEATLAGAAKHAPAGRAYDKVDITIEFSDGFIWRTQYDLHRHDGGFRSLASHVRSEWEFKACRWRPSRLTEKQHASYLKECGINPAVWAQRCDTYEIGTRAA